MKSSSKPRPKNIDSTIAKLKDMQREQDELTKRDMFIEFLGSSGLNLIDEKKHQQPRKRYLP